MSKAAFKKELALMTKEQLTQILLDSYDALAEFKEYYEFFLNPDVDKLMEKHSATITKELGKAKWGYSKAKITVLKNAVKKFIGFNPGPEAILNMLFLTLRKLGLAERCVDFKESQLNYIGFLVKQILKLAEDNQIVTETVTRLQGEIDYPYYTNFFKRHISDALKIGLG